MATPRLTVIDKISHLLGHYLFGPLLGLRLKLIVMDKETNEIEQFAILFVLCLITAAAAISSPLSHVSWLIILLPIFIYAYAPISQVVMEYRSYLSGFGVALLLVSTFDSSLILAAILVLFAILTIRRNRIYSDSLIFWQQATRDAPIPAIISAFSYYLSRSGRYGESETLLSATLSEHLRHNTLPDTIAHQIPALRFIMINLAQAKFGGVEMYDQVKQSDLTDAARILEEVIRLWPDHADGYRNLGCIRYYQRQMIMAIGCFSTATELDAKDGQSWYGLGQCYLDEQLPVPASECLEKAIELLPHLDQIRIKLAEAYNLSGNQQGFMCLDRHMREQGLIYVTEDMLRKDPR